jgi:CheY-like chemotaxis protein
VKFTQENGRVTLEVTSDLENNRLQLSVIDNGIGIAPADLDKLFQRFVQVDSRLNRSYEGTGLGLALVQKLTDLHGGSVQVESQLGKGSRFTISLPYTREQLSKEEETVPLVNSAEIAGNTRPPVVSAATPTRGSVLLVEDHPANMLMIADYLEIRGFEVRAAHNGIEAIELAEAEPPDLILMDIQMPVMDGLEATRRLRAKPRFAATPIIVLTALVMPGDRQKCLDAGATDYMSKPVSLRKLAKTIEEYLRMKR